MPYGINLQNELGETITEYSNVLYEKFDGITITPPTIGGSADVGPGRNFFRQWSNTRSGAQTPYYEHIASFGKMVQSGWNGVNANIRSWVGGNDWGVEDIAFVQPGPNGIWAMLGVLFRYPSNGPTVMQWAVCTYPDKQRRFKIASTDLPASLPGNYGMQIRKPNGQVCFDSRAKQISLVGHFYVPESDFSDVINHNAVKTYTIPTPSPNAFLSMPTWVSMSYTGHNTVYVPRLRQTSATEFTLDRVEVPEIRPGWIPPAVWASGLGHDATVMVAQDI